MAVGASNEMVRRREALRCLNSQMRADEGHSAGRLTAPVIKKPPPLPCGPSNDLQDCCEQLKVIGAAIHDRLGSLLSVIEKLPDDMTFRYTTELLLPTRDIVSFVQTSGSIDLGTGTTAGNFAVLVSIKVPEGYVAVLEQFGVGCTPVSSMKDVIWSVQISGDPSPRFSSNNFGAPTLATPLNFRVYVQAGRTIELRAAYTGSPVACQGILLGWFRPAHS